MEDNKNIYEVIVHIKDELEKELNEKFINRFKKWFDKHMTVEYPDNVEEIKNSIYEILDNNELSATVNLESRNVINLTWRVENVNSRMDILEESEIIHKDVMHILSLKYNDAVEFLKEKYGSVPYDYFIKSNFKSLNNKRISRTSEGLYIHHVKEDRAIKLSDRDYARMYGIWEYQQSHNLVYCNLLEHLALHVLISKDPVLYEWFDSGHIYDEKYGLFDIIKIPSHISNLTEGYEDFDFSPEHWRERTLIPGIGGAINYMIPEINHFFNGFTFKGWNKQCFENVKYNFRTYIEILKFFQENICDFYKDRYSEYITDEKLSTGYSIGTPAYKAINNKVLQELRNR